MVQSKFLKKNGIVGNNIFNIALWIKMFWKLKVIQFLLVGGTGVLIQLLTTFILTEYVFELKLYYIGYSIGLILNLIYNFFMHTYFTFKTKKSHGKRLTGFIGYSLIMILFQYSVVRWIIWMVGEKWYLLVISTTILIFSIISFLIFKLWLFKE